VSTDTEHLASPTLFYVDLQGACMPRASSGQQPWGRVLLGFLVPHRASGDPRLNLLGSPPTTAPHLGCAGSGGTRSSGRQAGPGVGAPLRSERPHGPGAAHLDWCLPPCSTLGRPASIGCLWPALCPLLSARPQYLVWFLWCGLSGGPREHGPRHLPGVSIGPSLQWRSHRLSPQRSSSSGPSRGQAAQPHHLEPWYHGTHPGDPRTAAGDRRC
jgi:hypothetical protein